MCHAKLRLLRRYVQTARDYSDSIPAIRKLNQRLEASSAPKRQRTDNGSAPAAPPAAAAAAAYPAAQQDAYSAYQQQAAAYSAYYAQAQQAQQYQYPCEPRRLSAFPRARPG